MLLTESLLGSSSAAESAYIEDVFSTWLYTGNGSSQTIANGVSLFGLVETTQYTGTGFGFSVNSDNKWGYVTTSPSFRLRRQDNFETAITLPGTSPSVSIAATVSDAAGNNYVGIGYTVSGTNLVGVTKFNSNGTSVLWNRRFSITNGGFFDITTDGTSVYIVGSGRPVTYDEGFLISISCATGVVNWSRSINMPSSSVNAGYSLALDSSSNVYVAGSYFPGGDFGMGGYILKFNSSGTVLAQNSFANTSTDIILKSLAVDSDGSIYLGGHLSSATYFVRKLNSSFAGLWTKTFTPSLNQANSISVGVGSTTVSSVFTDSTLGLTYVATFDKAGNLLTSSSAPGTLIPVAGISNRKPLYQGGKLHLLLDKVYVLTEANINNSSNILAGRGIPLSTTSFTTTAATGPGISSTFTFSSDTPSLTINATSYNPAATVVNAIAGKGGLVWMKGRSGATDHALYDTARGATFDIASNTTAAQTTQSTGLTSFLSNGFSIGSLAKINTNAATYASWTFREQPKFFDVVTYTGNGANRTIAHSLGSVPGCIMVKRTDATADWQVYHRSLANTQYMVLNSTAAAATGATRWNSTTPTATEFSLGTDATVNASGGTYVAYLFAHDAGGFGATGADNVISCGSYTGNGSATGPVVTLGYEPQWLLIKRATGGVGGWLLFDTMRGLAVGPGDLYLYANLTGVEAGSAFNYLDVNATGFQLRTTDTELNASGSTYTYIAIRRGPMRTPTTGPSVFTPTAYQVFSSNWGTYTSNGRLNGILGAPLDNLNPVDWALLKASSAVEDWIGTTRLTGFSSTNTAISTSLSTNTTAAESVKTGGVRGNAAAASTGLEARPIGAGPISFPIYSFARAPGFFDVVCYTGTGVARTVSHNLGVVPELMIFKNRGASTNWAVYSAAQGATRALYLNDSGTGLTSSAFFNDTAPTSSAFTVNFSGMTNDTAATYVAYLFASCPGVSKVGSYTGTGATQVINCGFAAGARFVLIKRTDSTGDWYVWDGTRGIVAGNDPYLLLNSTAAEVTNTDWVDTAASGFELSNAAGNLVNTNGASYIFLSVA